MCLLNIVGKMIGLCVMSSGNFFWILLGVGHAVVVVMVVLMCICIAWLLGSQCGLGLVGCQWCVL